MDAAPEHSLRAWVDYLRDLGIYDLYRRDPSLVRLSPEALAGLVARPTPNARVEAVKPPLLPEMRTARSVPPSQAPASSPPMRNVPLRQAAQARPGPPLGTIASAAGPAPNDTRSYFDTAEGTPQLPPELAAPMPKPEPLETLSPQPAALPPGERAAALQQLQATIGDCTRCPLAYAGRHSIVFGEGDPAAELFFVGEGPGADEDETGRPFVGKAGQLLNNMIVAMGLTREQVYIANVVKCRPPKNRAPEFVEATTCSPFLLQQIDIVRPRVIVALGLTAATYLLGVRQSLTSLRGQWLSCRGAKVAVTFHPAFLLRDPRQKGEAWKDLQRVMQELGLRPPAAGRVQSAN